MLQPLKPIVQRLGKVQRERGLRVLEEAAELAQALGCPKDQIVRTIDHVFSRPAGDPAQEVGGVATTLFAACSALEQDFEILAEREVSRIESKDLEHEPTVLLRNSQEFTTIKRIGWRLVELADSKQDGGAAAGFLRGVCFALECGGMCRESALNVLRRAYDAHQLGWKAKPGAHGGAVPLAAELINALVDEVRHECFSRFARAWYPITPKAKRPERSASSSWEMPTVMRASRTALPKVSWIPLRAT